MKSFSIKLVEVYLIFVVGIFSVDNLGRLINGDAEQSKDELVEINLKNIPTYTVISPKTASEVLMEREGEYVYNAEFLSLEELEVKEKKKVFIKLLLPAIDSFERELHWKREIVKELRGLEELNLDEKEFLEELFEKYKIKDGNIDRLLSRMIMPPKSLIISQGALESGWGTSRFFKEGNNIFGVWSYNNNEPRISAQTRSDGYTPHLKKYDSLRGAVEDYILLLSRSSHYSDLRKGLEMEESPIELTRHLTKYSELGEEYVNRVVSLIKSNDIKELD